MTSLVTLKQNMPWNDTKYHSKSNLEKDYVAQLWYCKKQSDADRALRVLTECEINVPNPSIRVYSLAMQSCVKHGMIEVAQEILLRMKKHDFRLDSNFFRVFVTIAANAGNYEVGLQVLDNMRKNCMFIQVEIYDSVILATIRGKRDDLALALLQTMIEDYFVNPGINTFSILLEMALDARDLPLANSLATMMCCRFGFPLSPDTVQRAIAISTDKGDAVAALNFYLLASEGMCLDEESLNSVLRSTIVCHDWEVAQKVIREITTRDFIICSECQVFLKGLYDVTMVSMRHLPREQDEDIHENEEKAQDHGELSDTSASSNETSYASIVGRLKPSQPSVAARWLNIA